jgi:hypothetical protein
MTTADMHYSFKMKLNKIDSQQYTNLQIPQIDWLLNEAQEIFIKLVAEPRFPKSYLGFETSQRTIDDIRTIVIEDYPLDVSQAGIAALPLDYNYFSNATVVMTKDICVGVSATLFVRQHDDTFKDSPFDESSFKWRQINGVFNKDGIKLSVPDGVTITKLYITYIKKPAYIHNAQGFGNGTYNLPSGKVLSGKQDCELPEYTHNEIVDIAVMLASGNLQYPDYSIKKDKVNNVNQLN